MKACADQKDRCDGTESGACDSNGLAEALAAAHAVTFTGSVEGLYACDLKLFPGGNIDV